MFWNDESPAAIAVLLRGSTLTLYGGSMFTRSIAGQQQPALIGLEQRRERLDGGVVDDEACGLRLLWRLGWIVVGLGLLPIGQGAFVFELLLLVLLHPLGVLTQGMRLRLAQRLHDHLERRRLERARFTDDPGPDHTRLAPAALGLHDARVADARGAAGQQWQRDIGRITADRPGARFGEASQHIRQCAGRIRLPGRAHDRVLRWFGIPCWSGLNRSHDFRAIGAGWASGPFTQVLHTLRGEYDPDRCTVGRESVGQILRTAGSRAGFIVLAHDDHVRALALTLAELPDQPLEQVTARRSAGSADRGEAMVQGAGGISLPFDEHQRFTHIRAHLRRQWMGVGQAALGSGFHELVHEFAVTDHRFIEAPVCADGHAVLIALRNMPLVPAACGAKGEPAFQADAFRRPGRSRFCVTLRHAMSSATLLACRSRRSRRNPSSPS